MSSMAKQKQDSQGSFWSELFNVGLYKPNQGRIVRQVTFLAVVVLVCLAAYEISRVSFVSGWFVGAK